MKHSECV